MGTEKQEYSELIAEMGSVDDAIAYANNAITKIDAEIAGVEAGDTVEWLVVLGVPMPTTEERNAYLQYLGRMRNAYHEVVVKLTR